MYSRLLREFTGGQISKSPPENETVVAYRTVVDLLVNVWSINYKKVQPVGKVELTDSC